MLKLINQFDTILWEIILESEWLEEDVQVSLNWHWVMYISYEDISNFKEKMSNISTELENMKI